MGMEVAEYQGKQYFILKFVHDEKHVIFNSIGEARRKKEICDGIKVIIALIVQENV